MRRGRPRASFAAAPSLRVALTADALQLAQELSVGAGLFELLYKELQLLVAVEGAKDAADLPYPLGLGGLHEELFLSRARVLNVDSRVDPLFPPPRSPRRDVHPPPPPAPSGSRSAYAPHPAVLDVPGRAEELLRR